MLLASLLPFISPFMCLLTKSWAWGLCAETDLSARDADCRLIVLTLPEHRAQHCVCPCSCSGGFSVGILQDFLPGWFTFIALITQEQSFFLADRALSSLKTVFQTKRIRSFLTLQILRAVSPTVFKSHFPRLESQLCPFLAVHPWASDSCFWGLSSVKQT